MRSIAYPMTAAAKTPGQLVRQLLEERGWTQKVLAVVLGATEASINLIIAGKRDIDAEWALSFSEVFGIPAERFMELQVSYELERARLVRTPDPGRSRRAALYGVLPVSEMIKRGWITADDARDWDRVEAALCRFFGVETIAEIPILPHAAKKTGPLDATSPVQSAWLYRVRKIASEMVVPRYSKEAALRAAEELSRLLGAAEEVRHVPRIMTEAGIRFVIVEGLPKAKIDGACFWLDDERPVIGLSLRHDRIDNFWFCVRHELEHVIQNHGKREAMVDVDIIESAATTVSDEERIANSAASGFCVPQREIESFILRKQPFFAERDVLAFAQRLRLHPGLVVGQIRYRTNRWDLLTKHLVKIRTMVAQGAMVDGWGDVAPVEQ